MLFLLTKLQEANVEVIEEIDPIDRTNDVDLNDIASTIIDWLFKFGLFVAVGALIVIAIRIMFSRATGDIDSAKQSSNGIGWVLVAVVLILMAPTLVRSVWLAFGGS